MLAQGHVSTAEQKPASEAEQPTLAILNVGGMNHRLKQEEATLQRSSSLVIRDQGWNWHRRSKG
jgi:hypothetical protein